QKELIQRQKSHLKSGGRTPVLMIANENHYIPRFGVGERTSNCNNCALENVRDVVVANVRWCTGARGRASEPSGNISTRADVDVLDNKYQVERLLGQGGMGAVDRATRVGR